MFSLLFTYSIAKICTVVKNWVQSHCYNVYRRRYIV